MLSITEKLGVVGFILGVANLGWAVIWAIFQHRTRQREQLAAKQEKVVATVVYNPAFPPHSDGWVLQVYVTNTSTFPLYLLGAVAHISLKGRYAGHLMDEPHGKGNPIAPGDRRYFCLNQPKDCPDIAQLPREAVKVTIESNLGTILTIPATEIGFIHLASEEERQAFQQ